ncbi:MAG: FemAB family XrtA/PEP-CTERM system-associated protein [Alphaproteobacteria bacterium]
MADAPLAIATAATAGTEAAVAIRNLAPGDESRWDAFVLACPEGTFFHLSGWRRVIETAFRHRTHYLLAERDGTVTGVLPLTLVKTRLFGTSLISNAFCVQGGPIAADGTSLQALDAAAIRLMEELRAPVLEFRSASDHRTGWVTRGDLYAGFRKPIDPSIDRNMKAIPRKQRAMVRKGIQNGLRSEIDRDADRLHRIYGESVRNLGTPVFPKRYFELLLATFPEHSDIVTITGSEGKPVASVLNFYFRDEVLPYYGGGTSDARRLAANDFMYWEVMRRACERGCRVFDFGRSKIGTGAYDFKTYWGFEPTPLVYQFRLAAGRKIPDLNPLNPKFALFVKLWRKLPLAVAARLGPSIVRGLG